ncbi:MAG: mandelate racemase/muconate lactonizing enzyme family protein [Candidatus Brachytrichaceae bacterium NZ_4S206]|jgi:L-alanine-DL-glutamate epimerase-like enolase superfamily enzyme
MESKRIEDNVRTYSRPSDLKITDVRAAALQLTPNGWMCPLIRIDTNQGIYGIGEVRDGASKNYALMLKRLLIGENPCNVDKLFRKIKQFGGHARQGGGVCAIEMALMDLAGKAYDVPCYMLAGGKFRDKIRMYCDTPNEPTGEAMGRKLQGRIAKGFTFLKMDVGIEMLAGIPGALCAPAGMLETRTVMHPFTHIRLTDKGIRILAEYVAQVRSVIGDEIPLAVDHFGHIGVEDCLRLGEALEPFNLAWLEDMVPWQLTEQWCLLRTRLKTPVCTGEDIYLHDNFKPLFEAQAISVCHPDLATAGGILETKKIGDLAQEYGISMAIHMAGSPVSTIAAVHSAAATENFIALEHHFTDLPYWDDFVTGIPKPIIQEGYIPVPEGPGLGIELNEEVIRAHLTPGDLAGYFEPSIYWDTDRSWDRLWS